MIVPLTTPVTPSTASATSCRHCGADLLGAGLPGPDGARFCCEGCRVVHGILAGTEGGVYYDLMGQAGAKAPRAGLSPEYSAWLEGLRDPNALRAIGRWDAGTHGVTLECTEMQCAACGWLMERVLGDTPGVLDYDVDFVHGEMHVRYDAGKTLLPDVLESIGRYGYAFKPRPEGASRPALDRTAWMRLAVAAACFMNAMAFAFGPYFGLGAGMDSDWVRTLGLWGFLSALPAVFYSAWPFYQGAWKALRGRAFTIDVTVTLGIVIAFTVSLAATISAWRGGAESRGAGFNYSDTLAGLVFFLLLGRYAVRRFEGGLLLRNRWHEALSPGAVRVIAPDGTTLWTPLADVKAGDVVEISVGEYLPVDGEALEMPSESGARLGPRLSARVDTAFLTGEDIPREVALGDFLFAGYRMLGAPLRLRVARPHAATRAAGLRRSLEAQASRRTARHKRRERVALAFTLTVAVSAILAFFLHLSWGWERAAFSAASVFIVSCSCALALAVPVSRGVGLLRAHRLGFHFRSQETLERLAEARSVLFDKTGTLTFTRRTLAGWDWVAGFSQDASIREAALRAAGRLSGMSAHPVAVAIHEGLARATGTVDAFAELSHFGLTGRWSPERVEDAEVEEKGSALHVVLCRYGAWERNTADFVALGLQPPPVDSLPAGDAPASCLFIDGRIAAYVRLGEEIKPGVPELLRGLTERGMAVRLLSGDHPDRVADFASRCGFAEYRGGLSPEEKQVEAREFQSRNGDALAVGDGYNDSLLFGESTVSVAVQGAAGPVAAEADAFMTSTDPAALLSLLRVAEGTRRSLRNCYVVSAFYNAGAITAATAGLVSPLAAAVLMPVASLSLFFTAWLTVPRK